jgi:hypothetical protein
MWSFKKRGKQPFSGRIVKDYGIIFESTRGIIKFRYSLLVVEEDNKRKVILKEIPTLIGLNTRYFELEKEGAQKLKEALENALKFLNI